MATKKKTKDRPVVKKKSLRDRLIAKKEEIKNRSQRSNIIRQKEEGTMRIRILPVGEGNEFFMDIINFWLGKDVGSVVSPATIGEPCAIMEKYKELKESDDEIDIDISKKLTPRTKPVIPVLVYSDLKGKKVDESMSGKLMQITGTLLQEIIDLYLDEDEWGDMTDPKNGYDLKITREGKGQYDTNYIVSPCKNTPINSKDYRKPIDLEALVKDEIDSYESTATKLSQFLDSSTDDDDDDDEKPKSKKKTSKDKKSKKKRNKDI